MEQLVNREGGRGWLMAIFSRERLVSFGPAGLMIISKNLSGTLRYRLETDSPSGFSDAMGSKYDSYA